MTDAQIDIAVAEHCGWVRHPKDKWIVTAPGMPNTVQPLSTIPKYCTDLNAMHEAEKSLTDSQGGDYDMLLWIIIQRDKSRPAGWHASARQRAEAFLKTVGKWEDGQ